jgi:branched-chain amino acid transport system permease protein
MLAFGGAMVLIMLWRPRGLLANRDPTIRLDDYRPAEKPANSLAVLPSTAERGASR